MPSRTAASSEAPRTDRPFRAVLPVSGHRAGALGLARSSRAPFVAWPNRPVGATGCRGAGWHGHGPGPMAHARTSNWAAASSGPRDPHRSGCGSSRSGRVSLPVAILPPVARRGRLGRDRFQSAVRLFWGLLAVPLHRVVVVGARPPQRHAAGVCQRGRRADRVGPLGTALGPRAASGGLCVVPR